MTRGTSRLARTLDHALGSLDDATLARTDPALVCRVVAGRGGGLRERPAWGVLRRPPTWFGPVGELRNRLAGEFCSRLRTGLDRVVGRLAARRGMVFASSGLACRSDPVVRQLWCFDPAVVAERCEGLFRRAQREYLSGNWVQAEQ